ncbi:glycosyltransferase N-terminal domain-containing protein [Thioalkalivibrio sulfidiphilus]|nr:glycosyltransferase N-terminal domain-containing protein [Thioalkalivibrio sulfidiphilus]
MTSETPDSRMWGPAFWPVLQANLRDRLSGEHARANARQGYLRQPDGRGKLLWIKSGCTPQSLRLGLELLGAIRQKRHDLRLVFTFELDDPAILEPRLKGLKATGVGYGPSDRPRAVARVLERLQPFGLILVDTLPHPNLLRAAHDKGVHCLAFNTDPWPSPAEAVYPCDADQHRAWASSGQAAYLASAADPLSLLAEAQADVTLRTLSGAGETGRLWWWHGPVQQAEAWMAAWRADARFADDRLFVSLPEGERLSAPGIPSISAWDRRPLAPGAVMWVDDHRWLAALASACIAGHLEGVSRGVFWQGLAGGRPLSLGAGVLDPVPAEILPRCGDTATVLARWTGYADDTLGARRDGDANRRRFWEERRNVEGVMTELLQRVFDW